MFTEQEVPDGQGRRGNDPASCLKGLHVFCDRGRGQDPHIRNLALNQLQAETRTAVQTDPEQRIVWLVQKRESERKNVCVCVCVSVGGRC